MIKVDRSDDELIVDQKPGTIAWFLVAFIVVWILIAIKIIRTGDTSGWIFLAGLIIPALFLALVERQTLVLNRPEGTLRLTKRTIYKTRHFVEELGSVEKAKTVWHGESTTRMGRLTILHGSGQMPFGTPQRKSRAQSLARQVNRWLDSKPPKA